MKVSNLLSLSALAATSIAHPVKRQNIDATVLQFALTLEHLENVFYKEALTTLSEDDFKAAGYSAEYYSNLKYIAHDEESHVQALTQALEKAGAAAPAACTYNFGITDVHSFITLSSVLEGVGTSAYLGAAGLITSKDYLTVAGSILVTEALHTSMQRDAAGVVPAANPYGTPLSPNPVYTLAASFITSCPASNPMLPFMAFPTLSAVQGIPAAPTIPFEYKTTAAIPDGAYVTYISGISISSTPVMNNNGGDFMSTVPETAMGQTYALLTKGDCTGMMSVADADVIAGPVILEVTPPSPTYDISIQK